MIAFSILSILTVTGALATVLLRNIVHCVLAAVLFFLGIAGFYFLLHAEFLGASQILIYVGAVATLMLFGIMLTKRFSEENETARHVAGNAGFALLAAGGVFYLLLSAVATHRFGAALPRSEPVATADIGRELLTTFLLPFEAVALLLTAALVGAIVIAVDELRASKASKTP